MTDNDKKMEKFYKEFVEPEEKKILQALIEGMSSLEEEFKINSVNIIERELIPATKSNPFLEQSTINESVKILELLIKENRAPKTEGELYILKHSVKDYLAKQIKERKFEGNTKSIKSRKGCFLYIIIIVISLFILVIKNN